MNMGWFGVELDRGLLRACSFPQHKKPRMFPISSPFSRRPFRFGRWSIVAKK